MNHATQATESCMAWRQERIAISQGAESGPAAGISESPPKWGMTVNPGKWHFELDQWWSGCWVHQKMYIISEACRRTSDAAIPGCGSISGNA